MQLQGSVWCPRTLWVLLGCSLLMMLIWAFGLLLVMVASMSLALLWALSRWLVL